MRFPTVITASLTAVLLASGSVSATDAPEPCSAQYFSAAVLANILDVSLTTNELSLLNGSEDPRLKRALVSRLLSAASDGRLHISQGAAVFPAPSASTPNLINGIDRALTYVAEHSLDPTDTPRHDAAASASSPSRDLRAIKAWLQAVPVVPK